MARPRTYKMGSEVYAVRVPQGTARLIRTAVRTLERNSGARVDVDLILLDGLLARLEKAKPSDLTQMGIRALKHVIRERSAIRSCPDNPKG